MRRCNGWVGIVLFAVVAQANEAISVDSQRGEELFQSLNTPAPDTEEDSRNKERPTIKPAIRW